jgi:hypothetical protein
VGEDNDPFSPGQIGSKMVWGGGMRFSELNY